MSTEKESVTPGLNAVCVYCGTASGSDPIHVKKAEEFGHALAAAKLKLVFGGGTDGVMGGVARGALADGGEVNAILPDFLTQYIDMTMFKDLTITETMQQRKHLMFERSDAFVVLPGGIGTVEEIAETMTLAQLGKHEKPMIFLNIDGFWNPMVAMLDHMRETEFLHNEHRLRVAFVNEVEKVIPAIQSFLAKK